MSDLARRELPGPVRPHRVNDTSCDCAHRRDAQTAEQQPRPEADFVNPHRTERHHLDHLRVFGKKDDRERTRGQKQRREYALLGREDVLRRLRQVAANGERRADREAEDARRHLYQKQRARNPRQPRPREFNHVLPPLSACVVTGQL